MIEEVEIYGGSPCRAFIEVVYPSIGRDADIESLYVVLKRSFQYKKSSKTGKGTIWASGRLPCGELV